MRLLSDVPHYGFPRICRPILLVTLFICTELRSHAQCAFRPAECPASGADQYGTPDDSTSRMSNPVLPLEITMENRLRRWTSDLMDRITNKEHWRYVELSEDVSSGARADDQSVLAYPLRPPHWMEIHYEVVIDEDSLAAWTNWLTTFAQRRLDATMQNAKQQTSPDKNFEAERRRMTIHYHEASLIFVEFDFNMDYVKTAGAPSGAAPAPAISGTSVVWFNNPAPEFNAIDLYERVHANAIVFAGNFNRTADGQGYRPAWRSDKTATNYSTPKKFKSDQIQSIDCHLSGNVPAIRKALADFSLHEMSGLLAGH